MKLGFIGHAFFFLQKSNTEALSEQSGWLKKSFDLMRYCYVKKCPLLFVSMTVSGVIRLNSAGPSHQFLLSLPLYSYITTLFLSLPQPFSPLPLFDSSLMSLSSHSSNFLCQVFVSPTLPYFFIHLDPHHPILLSSTLASPCLFKHTSWMSPSNICTPKKSLFLSFYHPPPHTLVLPALFFYTLGEVNRNRFKSRDENCSSKRL